MRVLLLGGTGFIGPFLLRRLVEAGHDVTIFHRGEAEPPGLPAQVEHVHGDLGAFEEHAPRLRELEPEVVVDMVPFRREEGRRVLAFAGVARRAVVLSSGDVYRAFGRIHRTEPGPPDPMPLTEDSPLREVVIREDYDKVGVERKAQADPAFPVCVLRLPAIHGAGDAQHRLYRYVRRMDDHRPAILLDESLTRWRWSRGYVEDMAYAVFLGATREEGAGRIYNVAEADAMTEAEWVGEIAGVAGWRGQVVHAPAEVLPRALRAGWDASQSLVVDTTPIRRELGYAEQVPRQEALRRTVEWERASPPPDLDPAEFDYAAEDEALRRLGRLERA